MKKPKPLATIDKLEIHRGTFHPFESVKYLDLAALQKAREAQIEIGRVEGGGAETTLIATIRRGSMTKLTPIGCKGCTEAKGARKHGAVPKKVLRAALVRIRELALPVTRLPLPVKNRQALLSIEIGPIVIYGNPFDICIVWTGTDGWTCFYCLFGPGICIGPIIFE